MGIWDLLRSGDKSLLELYSLMLIRCGANGWKKFNIGNHSASLYNFKSEILYVVTRGRVLWRIFESKLDQLEAYIQAKRKLRTD